MDIGAGRGGVRVQQQTGRRGSLIHERVVEERYVGHRGDAVGETVYIGASVGAGVSVGVGVVGMRASAEVGIEVNINIHVSTGEGRRGRGSSCGSSRSSACARVPGAPLVELVLPLEHVREAGIVEVGKVHLVAVVKHIVVELDSRGV